MTRWPVHPKETVVSDRRNTHMNSNALVRPLAGAALGLLAAGTLGVAQAASTICEPDGGYVVAYYNSTFAMPEDADAQRAALRIARHGQYTGTAETATTPSGKVEQVRYETFYSTAGTASGATASRFQALAGEYRKLLDGALTQNWEYFWDMASGSIDNWSVLAAKSGDARFLAVTAAFPAKATSLAAAAKAALQAELDSSSTTLAAHQMARAQALYTERQKLLMVSVASSQGALFANNAFAKLGVTDSSVSRQELSALPAAAIKTALVTNMAALTVPTPASNQGFFTATLSWTVPATSIGIDPSTGKEYENDFDIHIVEPGLTAGALGKHVHYTETAGKGGAADSLQGNAGFLDKDSVTVGPEHYYASCDESKLLPGVYEITLTQEGTRAPAVSNATLQIAFAKSGEVFSKTWKATELPGFVQRDKLVPVVKIKVDKIADGNWTAALVL
jgi:hypothetical protein